MFMPQVDPTCYIHPSAVIVGQVTLKKQCSVFPHAVIRGDENTIVINEATNVQDGCIIHVNDKSDVLIGKEVSLGHGAIVHGATIEDACIIGMHATILNDAVVGKGSIIGAGAVVTQESKIPPYSLVVGVPGKVVKTDKSYFEAGKENAEEYLRLASNYRQGKYEYYHP